MVPSVPAEVLVVLSSVPQSRAAGNGTNAMNGGAWTICACSSSASVLNVNGNGNGSGPVNAIVNAMEALHPGWSTPGSWTLVSTSVSRPSSPDRPNASGNGYDACCDGDCAIASVISICCDCADRISIGTVSGIASASVNGNWIAYDHVCCGYGYDCESAIVDFCCDCAGDVAIGTANHVTSSESTTDRHRNRRLRGLHRVHSNRIHRVHGTHCRVHVKRHHHLRRDHRVDHSVDRGLPSGTHPGTPSSCSTARRTDRTSTGSSCRLTTPYRARTYWPVGSRPTQPSDDRTRPRDRTPWNGQDTMGHDVPVAVVLLVCLSHRPTAAPPHRKNHRPPMRSHSSTTAIYASFSASRAAYR